MDGSRTAWKTISWLLRPHGDYRLRSLDLAIFSLLPDHLFNDAHVPALTYIRRLRLHPIVIEIVHMILYATILSCFTELREISIIISSRPHVVLDEPSYRTLQALKSSIYTPLISRFVPRRIGFSVPCSHLFKSAEGRCKIFCTRSSCLFEFLDVLSTLR